MASIELHVFTIYCSKLCNTLTDIDGLMSHFVVEYVIKHEDLFEISAIILPAKKMQKLMTHISGPLRAGNTEGFYAMLRIMENYGHHATQQLAGQMRESLKNNNLSSPNPEHCEYNL